MFEILEEDNGKIVTLDASKMREVISKMCKATGKFGRQETKWPTRSDLKQAHKSGAYSDEIVHLFRIIPATHSESNRPVIPKHCEHVVGAKRRWLFY